MTTRARKELEGLLAALVTLAIIEIASAIRRRIERKQREFK